MKQLPELLATAARNLRCKHQNVDLATLEEAVCIGGKIAVEVFMERIKQELEITVAIRNSPNAG